MPFSRIILQARLSSSRLPAKCLLPLGGYPLVVLSALRAANTGMQVVVATSEEKEDKILADVVTEQGLVCVRGSLNDVYSRILKVTNDMADDEWVIRLTGDNCLPDGDFIGSLLNQAVERKLEYLGTSSPADGLPYGLSAEVFTVRALRSVAGNEMTANDREHVTPAIRREYGAAQAKFTSESWAHLRCTVDTKSDYFRLLELFTSITDPVGISWQDLCERLFAQEDIAKFRIPWKQHPQGIVSAITLGTAQIGIKQYGRVNTNGQPSHENAFRLMDMAARYGITHIDTARVYGDAEKRIGLNLDLGLFVEPILITKLDPLVDLSEGAHKNDVIRWVKASVYRSLYELHKNELAVLMLHRWSHYHSHGGQIWQTVCRLKDEGVIRQLGASVSRPEEAIEALREPLITHLQIPFNILDHRWRSESFKMAREERPDVVVYSRSAYLQGILISDAETWPIGEGFEAAKIVDRLDALVHQLGRQSRADLCLAYLRASAVVDSIVVGVETLDQLEENLSLVCLPQLTQNEVEHVEDTFNDAPEWLLDPSRWS